MANAAWHVQSEDITQSTELKKTGTGLVDMYTIPYEVDSGPAIGHTGSVKVAVDQATPDRVAALINAQVARVHIVAPLAQDSNGNLYSQ